MVEEGRAALDAATDVEASVHAAFYFAAAQLAKARKDYADFYRFALLYLAYVSVATLPEATKQARSTLVVPAAAHPPPSGPPPSPRRLVTPPGGSLSARPARQELAVDLSLAALLGEGVYNFGELISHPVLKSLEGGPFGWLLPLLAAFNSGDLGRYEALCAQHAAALNAQPALVAHERGLRQKVTVLALMEILAALPADNRTASLAAVGARTRLSADGVELLLMKALSDGLVQGSIDQVAGTVRVTWLQPRVLLLPQVAELRAKVDAWASKVHAARLQLEAEAPELLAV